MAGAKVTAVFWELAVTAKCNPAAVTTGRHSQTALAGDICEFEIHTSRYPYISRDLQPKFIHDLSFMVKCMNRLFWRSIMVIHRKVVMYFNWISILIHSQ